MYHRTLAECFPSEEIGTLWFCSFEACFYHDSLMKWSEVETKEEWNGVDLEVVPKCPSCQRTLRRYEEDGKIQTFV